MNRSDLARAAAPAERTKLVETPAKIELPGPDLLTSDLLFVIMTLEYLLFTGIFAVGKQAMHPNYTKLGLAGLLALTVSGLWLTSRAVQISPATDPPIKRLSTTHLACGPAALMAVAAKCDPQAALRLEGILEREGFSGSPVASLHDLATLAKGAGLDATGLKVDAERALSRLPLPAVVHIDSDHFLALISVEDDRVVVIDRGPVRREILRAEFDRLFTGYALCVSRPGA